MGLCRDRARGPLAARAAALTNWKGFFNAYRLVNIRGDGDLLYQAGATVGGKPINASQFNAIVDSIKTGLQLVTDDSVLDLCCGNGVITHELAKVAGLVTGIDSSEPYIANAKAFKNAPNIRYIVGDVVNVNAWKGELPEKRNNKVLLYASLAYLTPEDLGSILAGLKEITTSRTVIMIGSVLDAKRKWKFFNTLSRRMTYAFKYRFLGRDTGVGRWWTQHEVEAIAGGNGYGCSLVRQNPIMHTAHYRFDAVLSRNS
jgi:SAM-dependent methyltransferase